MQTLYLLVLCSSCSPVGHDSNQVNSHLLVCYLEQSVICNGFSAWKVHHSYMRYDTFSSFWASAAVFPSC